jgi:hypothetical protein
MIKKVGKKSKSKIRTTIIGGFQDNLSMHLEHLTHCSLCRQFLLVTLAVHIAQLPKCPEQEEAKIQYERLVKQDITLNYFPMQVKNPCGK